MQSIDRRDGCEAVRRALAGGGDGGVELVECEALGETGWHEIEGVVRAEGFQVIRPVMGPGSEDLHRHTAICCRDRSDFPSAIGWIRALTQATPRRHLLIVERDLGAPRERRSAERLVEQRVTPSIVDRIVGRHCERARVWEQRRRPRSAERWLAAAAAAATRHGQGDRAVRLELEVCRRLLDVGDSDRAGRRLRALVAVRALPWTCYAEAMALFIDSVVGRGRLEQARALVRGCRAEALLTETDLPQCLRDVIAQVDFWQRRPNSLGTQDKCASSSVDEIGWRALAAWGQQRAGLSWAVSCLAALPDHPRGRMWAAVLAVLLSRGVADIRQQMRRADTALDQSGVGYRFRQLVIVAGGWALLQAEQWDDAEERLRRATRSCVEGRVAAALLELVKKRSMGRPAGLVSGTAELPALSDFVVQRRPMRVVEGLHQLLQLMDDAQDERGALSAGCRWARTQAGSSAVAVVTADGRKMLASDGWRPSDLSTDLADVVRALGPGPAASAHGLVVAPVRFAGATIGAVLLRPHEDSAVAGTDAALALSAVAGPAVRARLDELALAEQERDSVPEIVGQGVAMLELRAGIARAAPTHFPVLIEGESGTGKELAARAIHRLSSRRDRKFVAVNCAALSDELVEAELFGHARGAFTGAVGPRTGLFEEAHGGTLFLDEVAELSQRAQAKLLRALQEREIRRVGENAARPVDVRLLAATNIPLSQAVAAGRFRDDLRFRLAVVRLRLPALRERVEDLPLLAHLFWKQAVAETGRRAVLTPEALARLSRHAWPGNVRELQNVIASLAVAAPLRGRVTDRLVSCALAAGSGLSDAPIVPLDAARRGLERQMIVAALARHAGRRTRAATDLGLTRQGLSKALRRLGLADDAAEGVA